MGSILTRRRLIAAQPHIETASGAVASWKNGVALPLKSLLVSIAPVQSGSGDPSPENVRPITGWSEANVYDETEYDETTTPKLTIPFVVNGDTKTIYGGTVSVDEDGKVKLTADKAYLYVDGSVSVASVSYATAQSLYYTVVRSDLHGINSTTQSPHLITNRFLAYPTVRVGQSYITGYGATLVAVIPDQTATTAALVNAWFSDNPTQFVYDLAEPVEYDLSDVTVLSTLQGTNVMWADTGDISVKYWAHP